MSITQFDVIQANAFLGADFPSQGKRFFVKPRTGLDGNSGKSPRTALKTLAAALAKCTANQNDTVYLMAESNTAADTTDYQAAQLDWNKDLVHLIGVGGGTAWSPRSRIAALAAYAAAAPIMTVSANGCRFQDIMVNMGVADVNPLGALSVSGARNRFDRCHIQGFGAAANDIAAAYSLLLTGAEECEFHGCVIGSENIGLGANANSQIKTAGSNRRILFKDCRIETNSNHATNHLFLRMATGTSSGGPIIFDNCGMYNSGVTLTYGASIHATNVKVYFRDCHIDATDVSAADEANIFVGIGGVNNTSGLFTRVETT